MQHAPKKRIAIVGIVGLPARYGGFETLVNYLTLEKSRAFDLTVYCQKTAKEQRLTQFNNSRLHYLPFKANGAQSIIYDVISIVISWFRFDTILILGSAGCIILPFLKPFRCTRTIVNFGGLEWKRDKWGKAGRLFLKFSEKMAIKHASFIVADNEYFQDYIRDEYQKDSFLIEYGGDHASHQSVTPTLLLKYPFLSQNYDVSVSRAQPDNNLHLLLEAYSKTPKRNLVLISNYKSFEYGRNLKIKYASYPNIFMQDAVYDLNELDAIRSNARLYIHSHSFCGTAPSLVEAMHLGLPIIAFDVPTNRYTTEEKALYFKDKEELKLIINNLSSSIETEVSINMKEIAERRYTWRTITDNYASLFVAIHSVL